MSNFLRLYALCILISFYSLSGFASDSDASSGKTPEFIQVIKKPCYIGCDYQFQYCYFYDISNMKDGITIKEWHAEKDHVKGKAVADIKAKLLIKACYQLSLGAAYPVVDDNIDLEAEFDFIIKINNGGCIEEKESAVEYSSFNLKGNLQADPIPSMQTWLEGDMKGIIKDSFSKAVHDLLPESSKADKIYCGDEQYNTVDTDVKCQCEY
jgi:hypothetical protein